MIYLLGLPRVLELIQEHSEARTQAVRKMPIQNLDDFFDLSVNMAQYHRKLLEKDALSRMFHTLRRWELPLLFDNLKNPSTNAAGKRKRMKTRR